MQSHDARLAALEGQFQTDGIEYLLVQFVDIHGAAEGEARAGRAPCGDVGDDGRRVRRAGPSGGWGRGRTRTTCAPGSTSTSYTPLPYEPGVARFAADLYVDGQPHPYCPRVNLRRILERAREPGYVFNVGIEPEFFLVDRRPPTARSPAGTPHGVDGLRKPCYDFKGMSAALRLPAAP